jgi:hypothetical protein
LVEDILKVRHIPQNHKESCLESIDRIMDYTTKLKVNHPGEFLWLSQQKLDPKFGMMKSSVRSLKMAFTLLDGEIGHPSQKISSPLKQESR